MPAPFDTTPNLPPPLVSVIVRSMDRPSLAQALQSVIQQSHRPIELVLVNAKGQAHADMPVQVADLMLHLVAAEDGQPLPRARAAQLGLQAASGEWALFLDDDDELMPDHLSRLVQAGLQHAEAPAVYADVDMGCRVEGVWQLQHRFAADFDPVRLLFENYLPIHAVLFRREVALRHARFDADFDLFEDWDFWLQLAQVGAFVRVPGVSARYMATPVAGRSDVFEDSPAARTARERLFEKWRQRLSPGLYAQALQRLQSLHRQAGQQQAELMDLRRGHAEQAAVLQARESELADYAPRLAAREDELASARLQREAQQMILTAREQELRNALAAIEAQRELLAHRERESREGVEYASSLRETLAHREREIADATQQLADLRSALAAGQQTLIQRDLELASSRAELATLHAEKPLQALARTLRSKNKPHATRT